MIWPLSVFIQNKSQILFSFREFIKILEHLMIHFSLIPSWIRFYPFNSSLSKEIIPWLLIPSNSSHSFAKLISVGDLALQDLITSGYNLRAREILKWFKLTDLIVIFSKIQISINFKLKFREIFYFDWVLELEFGWTFNERDSNRHSFVRKL